MPRRKSLLISINYTGSENELNGCHKDVENVAEFIKYRGYQDTPQDQVVLRDDLTEEYLPTGHNILAAMDWLVSEEHTTCFFHYSGHGGQINDPNRKRPSGLLDTIVPVDFEDNGQIDSDMLHQHLVTKLPPSSTLFLILDCCHSGSTLELPFVYRSDDDGQVHKLNTYEAGVELLKEARQMMTGAFSCDKEAQARDLYAGATSFLRSLRHNRQLTGVVADDFTKEWEYERKSVTMFSGCRDEQTSADAQINGVSEGKYIMLVCTHDWRQILLSSQIRCHELGFSRSHEISRRSDLQGGKLWSTSFFQLY
jgi:hypothetical protein